EGDSFAALMGDDPDLSRNDEMQAARLFARLDELVARLEDARFEVLDQGGALAGWDRQHDGGRPAEVRHGLPSAMRRELGGDFRVFLDDGLEILALGDEQNRGARRDHTGGPGKLGEERHFTEECAASEARDDDGLSVGIGGAPRDFELTASDDV